VTTDIEFVSGYLHVIVCVSEVVCLECCFDTRITKAFTTRSIVSIGKIQHRSVRLSGAAESVSLARGGVSSTEIGIPSAELAGIYCHQGRLGFLHTGAAGHHDHESYKAGKELFRWINPFNLMISAACKQYFSANMLDLICP